MGAFIDRDPEQMMKYGASARSVLDDMGMVIRKMEGILDSSAPNLDGPTQAQIQKLHQCCAEYFKQMQKYEEIADSIYQKGKKLYDIKNGG